MSQTIINISSPNDGLGEKLRHAFDLQNGMNSELYSTKVDKEAGKGLTDNNFTDAEQTKLAGIEDGATVQIQSDYNQTDDTQPDFIKNMPRDINSMGWFMYNDLATQTTPLSFVTGVDKKLTNDTLGAGTQSTYAPFGVSTVWDSVTNQLNFTQLNVGDVVNMRVLVETTTTSANQTYSIKLKSSIGSPVEMMTTFLSDSTKTAGTKQQAVSVQVAISSTYARDYPSEFYIGSDGNGTIKVKGFYFSIFRKGLNIIDLSNSSTLQDITSNGATSTNPILIGDGSKSITLDADKFTVNPLVGLKYDVSFPTPVTPGDPVALASAEQLTTALAAKESTANKALPGGYASLDGAGKVPASQLPPASGGTQDHETLTGLLGGAANDHHHLTLAQRTALLNSLIVQITITTAVSITSATTDGSGYTQNGKNVIIDNGVNAINYTINGALTTSFMKLGTGAITFVQGSGRTMVQVDGTAVLNGIVGSTATITSVGTTDYLRISNA